MITYYREDLVAGWAYRVKSMDQWAYSPDGHGVFWYDTMGELLDQHGPVTKIRVIDVLED